MSSDIQAQHAAFLESMRTRVLESLRVAVGPERTVAVVGLPDHNNLGDSAIWIGTRAVLASLGIRVGYVATWWSYDRRRLVEAVGGAPVLLHGGGNLGDRYPVEQHVREQVLRDFRDRTVVQLPQTVSFERPARARSFGRLAHRHPSLRLMVRDHESRTTLEGLGLDASLSPDLVFGLADGRSLRPEPKSASGDVAWVARRDIEMAAGAEQFAGEPGVLMTDWDDLLGEPQSWPDREAAAREGLTRAYRQGQLAGGLRGRILRAATRRVGLLDTRPWIGRSTARLNGPTEASPWLDLLAEYRLSVGMSLLSGARVVVTDRLHAHLLSMFVGTPSVVYDNSDRKLRRYWDTWEPPAPLATWVSGPEEAWGRVRPGR